MTMATYILAVILQTPSTEADFLLVKQTRPPKFNDQEYDSYVDSDLWDLPSTKLDSLHGESTSGIFIKGAESCSQKFDFGKFDVKTAFNRVLEQVGLSLDDVRDWSLWKFLEEPEFGPGLPVHTVFVTGQLSAGDLHLREPCRWMSVQTCLNWLSEVKPGNERVGPLAVVGLVNDSLQSTKNKVQSLQTSLRYQEYPPGVMLVPMQSKTQKPFRTTNLVVFSPESVSEDTSGCHYIAQASALIVDPGCGSKLHEELRRIVAALPRKLVVFVTHHHCDHIDGLSIVQKCNPDAVLVAHEKTLQRIGKGDWNLSFISVAGGEEISVCGQRLRVLFSPGHTDGHMGLLHVSTHSLIVGDHCVGQGSAVLDITSGGNMNDYFQSSYKFMDLSPHVLIPMHGRVNLWPKDMLCRYLKNRRDKEASILKAIESGAQTLFDIVSNVYSEVDRRFWIPASSNVRLHVDHLAEENKLPKAFSIQKFQNTCGLHFLLRWTWAYFSRKVPLRYRNLGSSKFIIVGVIAAGFSVFYSVKNKLSSE